MQRRFCSHRTRHLEVPSSWEDDAGLHDVVDDEGEVEDERVEADGGQVVGAPRLDRGEEPRPLSGKAREEDGLVVLGERGESALVDKGPELVGDVNVRPLLGGALLLYFLF